MLKIFLINLAVATTLVASSVSVGVAAEMEYVPQGSNQREIKITVTPRDLTHKAEIWDFDMVLETHTQALNDDLSKSSVLIADAKQYLPSGWEGAPPGGHHRKGVLRFKAITPQPASVELQMRLAGDASPRSFKWLLK